MSGEITFILVALSSPLHHEWEEKVQSLQLPELVTDEAQVQKVVDLLDDIQRTVNGIRVEIASSAQMLLSRLEGKSFGPHNREIATRIQQVLIDLQHRLVCQHEGTRERCAKPSVLRFQDKGQYGTFHFEHCEAGRKTRHLGPAKLPTLILVPATPNPLLRHSVESNDVLTRALDK